MRFYGKKSIAILFATAVIFAGCESKDKKEEQKDSVETPKEIKVTEGVVKEQKTESKEVDKGEFYYSYKENEKNEAEIEEEESYTPIDAYRRVRSPYERVQISLLANKLSKDFLVHCSACHDDYANGIIGPSLLDKNETFIYNRLVAYKNRKKANVLMKDLVSKMSDEKLKSLAKEIADFNEKVRKIQAGEKVE
ncbi:c-type cytochrome [Nitrosophilus labii]|uniref:c-type cytochrome n=1 Tax=Nitrosophilus labii TaxID=2706014 RepID=UPI001656ECE9|nr:hypothetical protein [Nitrosophilus labii]